MHKAAPRARRSAARLAPPLGRYARSTNVNGIQVAPTANCSISRGLLIGDDGKVDPHARRRRRLGRKRARRRRRRAHVAARPDRRARPRDRPRLRARCSSTSSGTSSLADLQQRLRDYAAAHPDAQWIVGFGWNQELWPDKRFPTAADLDASVRDRPVVLERVDGHALVANSAAMKAAGVTAATPAPAGRRGSRTGLFVDNARGADRQGRPAADRRAESTRRWPRRRTILLGYGVTGVGSMSTSVDDWQAFAAPGDAGPAERSADEPICPALKSMAAVAEPTDAVAVRRPAARGRHQVVRRRSARLARRVAQAALCRQAGHARAAVPFGCGDARAGGHGGRARLPDRDPRDRRCGQCAGHRDLRAAVAEISAATGAGASSISRSSIRPTSRGSRRPGSSPRCSRRTRPATG